MLPPCRNDLTALTSAIIHPVLLMDGAEFPRAEGASVCDLSAANARYDAHPAATELPVPGIGFQSDEVELTLG